ncbi:UNVERIFIED_CONTAM: hypothetical protein FKN15_050882 [Acipenser sinensis]
MGGLLAAPTFTPRRAAAEFATAQVCLHITVRRCLPHTAKDDCLASPKDACLASPKDACFASPGAACCSALPGTACGSASPGAACCYASPVVTASPAGQQEVLRQEPNQGELPATKKGEEVWRPATPAAICYRRPPHKQPFHCQDYSSWRSKIESYSWLC